MTGCLRQVMVFSFIFACCDLSLSVSRAGRKPNRDASAAIAPSTHGVAAGELTFILIQNNVPQISNKTCRYRESVMTADPTPQFEIPNEMRAVAERSVEQAKSAFIGYMRAAEEAGHRPF